MPQSLGALGGKPNNAYYFIGFLGKEKNKLIPYDLKRKAFFGGRGNSKQFKHENRVEEMKKHTSNT